MKLSLLPIRVFRVAQRSMEPAIREGSYVIVNCWFSSLNVEDIVVASNPDRILIVKRVKKINKNKIFLLGDNIEQSLDGRKFGWIDKDKVSGRVIAII